MNKDKYYLKKHQDTLYQNMYETLKYFLESFVSGEVTANHARLAQIDIQEYERLEKLETE